MSKITYWFHPESDSYYIHEEQQEDNGSQGLEGSDPLDSLGDGLSVEISEYEYVSQLIDQIANDPEHKLPDGVDAVLRDSYQFKAGGVHGSIYYDRHQRFPDGHQVHISKILSKEPGGIYKTKNSTYLIHMIQPEVESVDG